MQLSEYMRNMLRRCVTNYYNNILKTSLLMDISQTLDIISALNSETRLRIIMLLQEEPLSTKDVQKKYNNRFDRDLRRESIYRALEKLRDSGLIQRQYDESEKNFVYSPTRDSFTVDFNDL